MDALFLGRLRHRVAFRRVKDHWCREDDRKLCERGMMFLFPHVLQVVTAAESCKTTVGLGDVFLKSSPGRGLRLQDSSPGISIPAS